MQEFKKRGLSACLNLSIGYADKGQPQGLSLQTIGNEQVEDFMPLTRHRCVGVAAPYMLRVNKFVQISRADDIRPYRALFHYSLLLITLSEAKQTPKSWLRQSGSPAGEPKAGERSSPLRSVKWNPCRAFLPLPRHRCVESPHPTNARQ